MAHLSGPLLYTPPPPPVRVTVCVFCFRKKNPSFLALDRAMERGSSSNGIKKMCHYEEEEEVGSGPRPKTSGGPAKKGRPAGLMQGYCQVEGCNVDLSDAKTYYLRHKVCGVHSKSPKVIVAGIEQRFCQQCSRFHQLPEFDQGKRSCRRRLAGHNERRRKPPQEYKNLRPSIFDNNHTSKTGGFVMDFSAYPLSPTGRDPFENSALEQGFTTNRDAITGKLELPWPNNSPQNPLSDLLTSRPRYSVGPVMSSHECFNGVSESSNAHSLLSNQPLAGPKSRLVVVNSFLDQPSDNNPGSAVGQFVCSPWILKGNGDSGLGQASEPSNGQYNGGLGLALPSVGQFDELHQPRGYDSSSVGQHMQWSL